MERGEYVLLRQQLHWTDEVLRSQGSLARLERIKVHRLEQLVARLSALISALQETLLRREIIRQVDLDLNTLD